MFRLINAIIKKPDHVIEEIERRSSTSTDESRKADHLAVLVHGLWGSPSHLWYLSSALHEKYPEDKLHILVAKRNSGSFTYDGIELGGERVTQEIEQKLEELAAQGQRIKKISVIGYSLGGLVARYAIGLLHSKGWFERIQPVNFTTFATPHLGVRTPLLGYHNHLWNVLGARLLSMSGRQLFTIDSFRDTGRPLLSVLADPDSIFIQALGKFKHRSLYCNIVNDRSAVYYTTGIAKTDPFVDMSAVNVNYLKGYEPVILDPDNPVKPKEPEAPSTFAQKMVQGAGDTLYRIPFAAFIILFMTIGIPAFLITSAIQSVRSGRRIRLHHEGKSDINPETYRVPLLASMVQEARQTAEDIFENVNQAQSQEYLPAGIEEVALEDGSMSPTTSPVLTPRHKPGRSISSVSEKLVGNGSGDEETTAVAETSPPPVGMEMPTLALTAKQFAMIQALDDVGFKKYPVWIHNVRHSHAAIIVRMNRARFDEGKVVVRHWLSEFEI